MAISGKRIRRTRLIHTPRFVVAVEVELVIPDEDSSEPCYEPETVRFLREVEEHAKSEDREWLLQHGQVYELLDAA